MYEQRLNSLRIQYEQEMEACKMTHGKSSEEDALVSQLLTVLQEEKQVLLSALVAAGKEKDVVEKRCEAAVIATREDARREKERAESLQIELQAQKDALRTAQLELAQIQSKFTILQIAEQNEALKIAADLQLESEHSAVLSRETAVSQLLKKLKLLDVATNGDAMILQELSSMGALGSLADIINGFHLFELVAKTNCVSARRLLSSPLLWSHFLSCR